MQQSFDTLLERYLTADLTPAERDAFIKLLASDEYAEHREQFIDQLMQEGRFDLQEDPVLRQLLYQRLQQEVPELSSQEKELPAIVPKRSLWRGTWFRYAAAAIIVLSAGTWWWITNNKTAPVAGIPVASADIEPGRDRATLTLASGQTILLDSTEGNIVQQGAFKIMNGQGKLDYEGNPGTVEYHTLTTPRGGQYRIQLPDGTAVWLNAASSIRYPTAFTGSQRNVYVTGEVYFEVAANHEKPFIVDIDGRSAVEVLGTKFNINSYGDEETITTTLLQGRVKVNNAIDLKPGQQAVQKGNSDHTNVNTDADLDKVMAWKNGLFDFTGANVPAVMRQLARWYNIQVRYEGPVPQITFKGKLDRGVNLSEVLEILPMLGIHYRMEGRTLIVMQ